LKHLNPVTHLLALTLTLSACRGPEVEILTEAGPILSCEEAFARGADGDACAIREGLCQRDLGCCVDEAICESGVLFRLGENCDGCGSCVGDAQCALGSWCIGGDCIPCAPDPACPPCPAGLESFERNGCGSCECVPAVQCLVPSDCDPAGGGTCVPGSACAPCGDGECCSSACADPDCPALDLTPEGCERPCSDPGACPSGVCRQLGCFCDAAGWRCTEECVDELRFPC